MLISVPQPTTPAFYSYASNVLSCSHGHPRCQLPSCKGLHTALFGSDSSLPHQTSSCLGPALPVALWSNFLLSCLSQRILHLKDAIIQGGVCGPAFTLFSFTSNMSLLSTSKFPKDQCLLSYCVPQTTAVSSQSHTGVSSPPFSVSGLLENLGHLSKFLSSRVVFSGISLLLWLPYFLGTEWGLLHSEDFAWSLPQAMFPTLCCNMTQHQVSPSPLVDSLPSALTDIKINDSLHKWQLLPG